MTSCTRMIAESEEGLKFEIIKETHSAKVIKCNNNIRNVFIPRFFKYGSEKYPIKAISKESFQYCSAISISFPEDSELETIESNAFSDSQLEKIYFPESLIELEEGWCKNTRKLTEITISPKNKRFSKYNKDLFLGKTNPQSDTFDVIYFASKLVKNIKIPSFIKKINSFAFSDCDSLLNVEFSENSELEVIGKCAFYCSTIIKIALPRSLRVIEDCSFQSCTNLYKIIINEDSELRTVGRKALANTSIRHLFIPANLNELKDGWCCNLKYLESVSISPNNRYFSVFEDKMIVGRTNPNDSVFDVLCYYFPDVTDIFVPQFIKKIGSYACESCDKINAVSFSEDSQVEIIENSAFSKTGIEEITIPKSVISIGKKAFYRCWDFKKISFQQESKLTTIGSNAFNSTNIPSICIPKHVRQIEESAFFECDCLDKVEFEKDSELEIIGEKSFCRTSIESIVIPKSVELIDDNAFSKCHFLENVLFEENSKLKTIKSRAFYKTLIKELNLPSSIETLEEGWCQYTNKLINVEIPSTNQQYKVLDNKIILSKSKSETSTGEETYDVLCFVPRRIEEVKIPSYIRQIGLFAFSGCSKLKSVTFEEDSKLEKICNESFSYSSISDICIPKHVKIIDDFAFQFCDKLKKLTFSDESELQTIGEKAFYSSSIKSMEIPLSVKIIKDSAFCLCQKLKSFEFIGESQIQNISKSMLSQSKIRSIKIPNHVTIIEDSAFFSCFNLKKVDISEESELISIKETAFSNCSITNFYIPPHLTKIMPGSFTVSHISVSPNNKYLADVDGKLIVCKSDVNKDIYDVLLYSASNIEQITIPSYIKKIDKEAFMYCQKLAKVEFAENSELEIIGKRSFKGTRINSIIIPDHVKIIDEQSFDNCYSLTNVVLTENSKLEYIGTNAFSDARLEELFIPKTVKKFDDRIYERYSAKITFKFADDSQLQDLGSYNFLLFSNKTITVLKHVKEIHEYALSCSNEVESIIFPEDSELQTIHDKAFSNIKSLNFPAHLKEIGRLWALNIKELNQISISPNNHHFAYIDEKIIATKSSPNIDHYDTIVFALRDIVHAKIPSYIKIINPCAFAYCNKLKSIEIPENSELEIIDEMAFFESSIISFDVPKSVKIIGESAFKSSSIQSIQFAENSELKLIFKDAFDSTKIERIVFPRGNILIQPKILECCYKLQEIILSDDTDSLYPFVSQDTHVKKINIPPKIDNIDSIRYNDSLEEVHVSPQNKYFCDIGGKMIFKKSNPNNENFDVLYFVLKSNEHVIIPSYIKIIKSFAFKNCVNINALEFSADSELEIIENNAFNSSSITEICIPKHVKRIDEYAFWNCLRLETIRFVKDSELKIIGKRAFSKSCIKSIVIPKSVELIDENAFAKCGYLESVSFEENSKLKTIKSRAFYRTPIKTLDLPSSIETLEEGWCQYTKKLIDVKISSTNQQFKVLDNKIILSKSNNSSESHQCDDLFDVICFAPRNIENVCIPSYIRSISSFAFSDCLQLDRLSFKKCSKLETLCSESFSYSSVSEVLIPKNIKTIGESCFYSCRNLSRIEFDPDSSVSIEENALSGTAIKGIIIPKHVSKIEANTFFDCLKLKSIEFLSDTFDIPEYMIDIEVLSFPNAHSISISACFYDNIEIIIYILPFGDIKYGHDEYYNYGNNNDDDSDDNDDNSNNDDYNVNDAYNNYSDDNDDNNNNDDFNVNDAYNNYSDDDDNDEYSDENDDNDNDDDNNDNDD